MFKYFRLLIISTVLFLSFSEVSHAGYWGGFNYALWSLLTGQKSLKTYGHDLNAALTAIGTTEVDLICSDTVTIASGTTETIPATINLIPTRGCLFQGVAGGGVETLTTNCGIEHKTSNYLTLLI